MSYQTILFLIDRDSDFKGRLRVATDVARSFSAHLVGLYLVEMPEMLPSVAAALPSDIVERYVRAAHDTQRATAQAFRDAVESAGWNDVEWRAPSGPPIAPYVRPIDAAVAYGRCADLIVVEQPQTLDGGSLVAERLVTTVLMETGRPLLVVPYVGAPETIGTHVLVAWDGGREAARAIADAIPLLRRARRVTVASVDPGASARGVDALGRERFAGYLQRHGIAAHIDYTNLGADAIPVGEWLLSRVADIGADLIVMGGYGHARWREQVLGGVTRTLFSSMTVPVLMAH
jgi:nucleotide-binding universal stress UspA family protein